MGNMLQLESGGQQFEAYLAEPNGTPKGGIVVIHEIWALSDHIKDVTDRFAAEGWVALAPNLLSMTDIAEHADTLALDLFNPEKRNEAQPKLRALMTPMQEPGFGEQTLAKLEVCFNTLYDRPDVKQNVVVTGYCFGGTYSFKLAAAEPRLKLALPFYGHTEADVDELKQIKCPVKAFYGQNDPGLIDALPEVKELMAEAGVDFTVTVYEDAGHAFFNDTNRYAYNEKAAKDAWGKVKAALDEVAV